MKRVSVIGAPGTGKTTFAKRLAEKTKLPLIHLDYYYHQKRFNYYKNTEEWRSRVEGFVKGGEWIIDGNFQSTYNIRFPRADTIIFLDYKRRIYIRGVIKRWLQDANSERSGMPEDWKEKPDLKFLKLVWNFNKEVRPVILNEIENNKGKQIVILKNRKQAEQFLYDGFPSNRTR